MDSLHARFPVTGPTLCRVRKRSDVDFGGEFPEVLVLASCETSGTEDSLPQKSVSDSDSATIRINASVPWDPDGRCQEAAVGPAFSAFYFSLIEQKRHLL